jgi:hypothetical protein
MKPAGKPRCMWENDIQVGLKEIIYENVDQIHLTQNRTKYRALVEPQCSIKGRKLLDLMSDYLLLQNRPASLTM